MNFPSFKNSDEYAESCMNNSSMENSFIVKHTIQVHDNETHYSAILLTFTLSS